MTQEQFEAACGATLLLVRPCVAKRTPEAPVTAPHLTWMLMQAALFHAEGRTDKANRWLGFVQGVLAADGIELEDLKRANMPDGAEYDPERI